MDSQLLSNSSTRIWFCETRINIRTFPLEGEGLLVTEFRKQTDEERRDLSAKLRAARDEAGLYQYEAARLLGISQSVLSEIESGERRLDVAELRALAKLYNKDPAWFLRVE